MSNSINRYTPPSRLEPLQALRDESIATGLATQKEEDSKARTMPFGGMAPTQGTPVRSREVESLPAQQGAPAGPHSEVRPKPYRYFDGTLSAASSHSTGAQQFTRRPLERKHGSDMLSDAPHESGPSIGDTKESPSTTTRPAADAGNRERTLASELWRASCFGTKASFRSGNIPRNIFSLDAEKLARELHAVAGDEMPTVAAGMWDVCKRAAESNSPNPKWLGRFYRGWVASLAKADGVLTEPDLRQLLTPLTIQYSRDITPLIGGSTKRESNKNWTRRIAVEDAYHFSLQAIAKHVDPSGRDLVVSFIPMHEPRWSADSGDTARAFTRAADRAIAGRQQPGHTSGPRASSGAPSSSADVPPPLNEADFRIASLRIEPIAEAAARPDPDGVATTESLQES